MQARLAAEKKATLVADCEAELARVMPPLLKAMRDLKAIDKNSIAELKVMVQSRRGNDAASPGSYLAHRT
jgi:hypothetical protein